MNRLRCLPLLSLSALSLVAALSATGCRNTEASVASAPTPQASPVAARTAAEELATLARSHADVGGAVSPITTFAFESAQDRGAALAILLEANRCYTVLSAGVPSDLIAYDGQGKVLARGDERGQLAYCASAAGLARVEVVPRSAVGSVVLRAYANESTAPIAAASRGPRAPRAPREKEDALSLAISRQASVSAGGGRRAYLFRAVGVKDDDRTDWYPRLEANRCYTFVGAGVDKVKELSVYLWDGAGKRITENRASGPSAVMSHCPKVSGPYHIQAKMTDGAGAYGIGVYAK